MSLCADHEAVLAPIRDLWRRARENEIEPSPDAWTSLRERLETTPSPRRRSVILLLLPACAAVAAVLVFAFLIQPATETLLDLEPRYGDLRIGDEPIVPGRTSGLAAHTPLRNVGAGPARIDLADASVVLAPRAALAWRENRAFALLEGTVLVRTSRPMSLEVGTSRVDVLGTEFAVERTGSGATVHVLRGRVRLTGRGEAVELPAGTRATCPDDGSPTPGLRIPVWSALDWLGRPGLRLRSLSEDATAPVDLEILVETRSREEIPIRPFSASSPDFLLDIVDPAGGRFSLKILPAMIVEQSRSPGHRAAFPLVRGHAYRLRVRLEGTDVFRLPGTYAISASYTVRAPAGESLWHGRLTSEPVQIRR